MNRRRIGRFPAVTFWLLLLGVVCNGCRLIQETARVPTRMVATVVPGTRSTSPDPAVLQARLQRYADEFSNRTISALDEYARLVGTPEADYQALHWKVSVSSAVVAIASGPNPRANLLDLLALASITRMVLEENWTQSESGAAFQPWLQVSRVLEAEAWELAALCLSPAQQQELREIIRNWWESNAGMQVTFFARPQEFSSLIRQSAQPAAGRPGSVFAVFGLDPTAGLDPAMREVMHSRLLAERAMYTAQRMPSLLRWQTQLLTAQLLRGPQVSAVLTNMASLTEDIDRLSHAVDSISQTAALLPDRLSAERKAILDELTVQQGRLQELSAEVGRTLVAGEKMSTTLNTTLLTLDALIKPFRVGEPSNAPPHPDSPPFNILDYARTAEQITTMAEQLDALLQHANTTLDSPALGKRIENLNALAERAKADAKSVLNHAFLLAAGLVVLVLAGAIAYRRFGSRN